MKVIVTTLDEFFECLDAEKNIYQRTIRVCIARRPIDVANKEPTKFEVILQAAAVVEVEAESQYLLQIGISCGKDYEDASQERKGSELAAKERVRIQEYAAKREWRVLPGVIEE